MYCLRPLDQSSWTKRPQLLRSVESKLLRVSWKLAGMWVFSRRSFQIPASVKEQREARLGVRTPGFPNIAPEQMCTPGQVAQVPSSIICNMKEFDSSSTKCFSDSFFLPRKKSSTVYYLEKSYVRCLKEVLIPPTFTLSEKGGPSTNHSVLSNNSCNHHIPV